MISTTFIQIRPHWFHFIFFSPPNPKQMWIWSSLRSTYKVCQEISTSKAWMWQIVGSEGEEFLVLYETPLGEVVGSNTSKF